MQQTSTIYMEKVHSYVCVNLYKYIVEGQNFIDIRFDIMSGEIHFNNHKYLYAKK